MPRNTAALKPAASRPLTRRNSQQHQCCCSSEVHNSSSSSNGNNINNSACKAGLPVSLSASLDISVSMAPSAASSSSAPPKSAASGTAASQSVSDDPQHSLQDTLYEYVKGLQDAIKVPDPDLAERLLEEIGNSLTSPSAVSLIISANGARLMASCVKHFRWSGMQKPVKVASKLGRSKASPSSKCEDPGTVAPQPRVPAFEESSFALAPETPEPQMEDVLLPESRRKRQRTAGDMDDDEDAVFREPHQNGFGTADKEGPSLETSRRTVKLRGRVSSRIDAEKSRSEDGTDSLLLNGCWPKQSLSSSSSSKQVEDEKICEERKTDGPPGDLEQVSSEEESDSVYLLAKASGMSSVVSTACSGLDKLLNAALQVKNSGTKWKGGSGGLSRRGKSLSAEMYVALTEAFVDMVLVLKDNVDLLSWCLNCLGTIYPPGALDRPSFDSATMSSIAPLFTAKETVIDDDAVKPDCSDVKLQTAAVTQAHSCTDQQLLDQKLLLKLATKYRDASTDFTLKIGAKSSSGSYVAAARSLSANKSSNSKSVLPSTLCSGITSESTSSSISALAAVAYAATVPMLAEKAVKAVLSAMQSCDIESHSTLAALRALSAHLSSTNTKSACDDAFAFIIAAMREFVSDAEMQAESCIALGSLNRAVTSTTGHAAWAAITISMDHHQTNLVVQRAGCGALQVLCTRTGLGVPEWRTGKRPLRASRDSDREAGAKALIASMNTFPDDVRIQWHGCSTLWTLVHSAGVKGIAKMVKYGAVSAVVGAMSVCRMNEMMQQEGCNVIGTMVRTLAENGHEIGLFLSPEASVVEPAATGDDDALDKKNAAATDWWAALGAVVGAMKMFSKSKSLQSNGTFALGCILKGSGETANLYSTASDIFPLPTVKSDTSKSDGASASKQQTFFGKDIVDNVEKISAAVEVTMAAMKEFSKVETVQVWGCAVLQQAFLAYIHYARCLAPVSEARSSCEHGRCSAAPEAATSASQTPAPSPSDSLAKLILSQATSAMCMISRTMALSYSNNTNGAAQTQPKTSAAQSARTKTLTCARTQGSTQFFSSVRQSWCAALGAIGDVFGYLTRNSEVAMGKVGTECMDFFRSNKSFFDRSACHAAGLQLEANDEPSEFEDVDQQKDREGLEKKQAHNCSAASWMDWAGFGASQQQAVKDIKAWQEATEAMAKIAENVGFPVSVKNAIFSIRTIFSKLEDAETVIWACHALVSLYLTWENLHLFKPGIELDREEYKAKIWGDGEAGVKQLVDLVVHWSNQNRPDVTSLALQALYGACVFAATVQEIEKVFALGGIGAEAVLGAIQKALSSGSAQHRRKVVQQGCCVLATVCGYSLRAQVALAAQGGADLILTALDRYNEDNQIQVNGLHALGVDSHAQYDFDAIWNAAVARTTGGKSGRRKRGNQGSSVGLCHIFREGVSYPSARDTASDEGGYMESAYLKGKWNPHFEKLVLDGGAQIGLFRTALLAAPGCGAHAFAVEVLGRLGGSPSQANVEMQAHVCFVIGYMAEHDPMWRKNYLDAGALEAVSKCTSTIFSWKQTVFTSFRVQEDDGDVELKAVVADAKNNLNDLVSAGLDARIQCATACAVAGLAKDQPPQVTPVTSSLIQALATALHRYGGLLRLASQGLRYKKWHKEVCSPARVALARLGACRFDTKTDCLNLVHEAAETGDISCLKALAECGCDIFVADSEGKTGVWYAELAGSTQAVDFFKEQLQLQGKKKVKEKTKAKNKASNRKKAVSSKEQETEAQARPSEENTTNQTASSTADSVESVPVSKEAPVVEEGKKAPKQKKEKAKGQKKPSQDADHSRLPPKEDAVSSDKESLNAALQEAMASGDVEKMEVAIKACMEGGEAGVDEKLLKTVKAALAKRLKRRERANAMEYELTAAMEEESFSRLKAAIVAVENVPRFATALQEKLAAARKLLCTLDVDEQHQQETTPSDEEPQQQKEARREVVESLAVDDGNDDEWISTYKSRRRKEAADTSKQQQQQAVEEQQTSRGKRATQRQRKQKLLSSSAAVAAPAALASLQQPTLGSNSSSSYVNTAAPAAGYAQRHPEALPQRMIPGQYLPPLLPTPRHALPVQPAAAVAAAAAAAAAAVQQPAFRTSTQSRSVIMPPKAAAAAAAAAAHTSTASNACEHNPITPQLFPSSSRRSPLICEPEFSSSEQQAHSQFAAPSSWSSPKSSSSLEDESFKLPRWGSWSGSRSSTPVEEYTNFGGGYDCWPDSGGVEPSANSSEYINALLSTLFPTERLPSSSTTLFSASLGELPSRSVHEECTKFTSASTSAVQPTPTRLGDWW